MVVNRKPSALPLRGGSDLWAFVTRQWRLLTYQLFPTEQDARTWAFNTQQDETAFPVRVIVLTARAKRRGRK